MQNPVQTAHKKRVHPGAMGIASGAMGIVKGRMITVKVHPLTLIFFKVFRQILGINYCTRFLFA